MAELTTNTERKGLQVDAEKVQQMAECLLTALEAWKLAFLIEEIREDIFRWRVQPTSDAIATIASAMYAAKETAWNIV